MKNRGTEAKRGGLGYSKGDHGCGGRSHSLTSNRSNSMERPLRVSGSSMGSKRGSFQRDPMSPDAEESSPAEDSPAADDEDGSSDDDDDDVTESARAHSYYSS